MKSCVKSCAKPHRKVKNAYQTMVICSTRTRPQRSDSAPASQPPNAETSNVMVPSSPACAVVMCQSASRLGMTNEKICTSSASSDQPPKQATMVRRSRAVRSENQANMTFRPLRAVRRNLCCGRTVRSGTGCYKVFVQSTAAPRPTVAPAPHCHCERSEAISIQLCTMMEIAAHSPWA